MIKKRVDLVVNLSGSKRNGAYHALGGFAIFFLLLTILGNSPIFAAQGSTNTQGCMQQIAKAAEANEMSFQKVSAINLAKSSNAFEIAANGYSVSFNSIFDLWSFDPSCVVTLTSVNIVFQLTNNSKWAGYVVVAENPRVSEVMNVTLQQDNSLMTSSHNWSGYEMYGNVDGTLPVYKTTASWSVPSASQPNPPSNACVNKLCDIAIWTGLVHSPGGSTGIAQAGSQSSLDCSSGCGSAAYNIWYEFYPSNSVVCSSSVSSGDSVQVYVLNHGIAPGGNTSLWDLQITDSTSGKSCTLSNQGHNFGVPYYGEFIAERPQTGLFYDTVPKFSTVTITGNIYYGGSLRGIYTPYSNGWYTQYVMQNGGYTNIATGAVTSSSTFTETFSTAQGT